MKYYSLGIVLSCLLVSISTSFAQKNKPFKAPSKEALLSTSYQGDTSVPAAYLKKECYTQISYYKDLQEPDGFKADITYRNRIKIYKNKGIKYTKDSIYISISDDLNIDKLSRLTITTYNLQDDKVVKTILKEKDCIIDKRHKDYHIIKYAAQDVYVGSIVDIQYSVRTPNLVVLPTWYYQSYIPIQFSFYEFMYPEFIDYKVTANGLVELKKEENSTLINSDFNGGDMNNQYTEINKRFSASNVPAFKTEPFIGSSLNYIGFLDFNIAGYQIPGGFQQQLSYSWEEVGQRLLQGASFGRHLREVKFLEPVIDSLTKGLETPKEKALAILGHLQKKVIWNKKWQMYSEKPLRMVYDKGVGNISDVNLLLVAALKKAGLKAYPIMLSTTGNRFVNPLKPSISSFNYVIAGVELKDQKFHFLDANTPFSTLDLLPYYCLSSQGLRLGEYSNWVDLPNKKFVKNYVSKIKLTKDGLATGTLQYVGKDYGAYELRNMWKKAGNQLRFFKQLERDHQGLIIQSGSIKNMEGNHQSVALDLLIRIKNNYKINAQTASFTPTYLKVLDEAFFTSETRVCPIQFPVLEKQSFVMSIEIPQGYQVKSLPQSEIIRLPNKAAQYSYSASVVGENIQIVYSYQLKQRYFPSSIYPELKAFYEAILRKQKESIIFKKT
ncbi:hypothetical protein [Aureispira sp. CCB-E]|uniref:hypothetical protein n=1 Tax=Aureispira sp. CCB-E TaxID=3051121 RepID=UPI0028697470|nr:hypothetical protein [Aureispira sp. CCB-E]WMX16686.1 hypothetical protein QP953_09930 [Aureispira sp. CCB-E]